MQTTFSYVFKICSFGEHLFDVCPLDGPILHQLYFHFIHFETRKFLMAKQLKICLIFLSLITGSVLSSAGYRNSSGSSQCPSVFVYIEDSSDPTIQFVAGTNCAMKCISSVWSHTEWKLLLTLCTIAMWIGMPLDIFIIVTWSFSKKKQNQYFVLAFAICSFIMQITLIITSFYSFEDVHCRNAAVPIGYRDGFALCNVQSFLFVYGIVGACISWMLQSIDLFMKVVLKKNDTKRYKPLFLGLIFGVPPFILLTIGVTKSYGYQPGTPNCMVSGIYTTDCVYVPALLCLVVGAIAIFVVIFVIVRHTRRLQRLVVTGTGQSTRNDMLKMVKGSAFFVLSFFMLSIPAHSYRLYSYLYFHEGATFELADWSSWSDCIFQHYDGVNDESWLSICGAVPPRRVPLALAVFQGLSAHGTGLLISSTYLVQPSVWKIWRTWLKLDGSSTISSLYTRKLVVRRQTVDNVNRSVDPMLDRTRVDATSSDKKVFMSCNSVEINVKDKYILTDSRSEKKN